MKYRKLTELKKLEGNPRTIEDEDFKTLCDSIRDNPKYFEARPLILSDRTGELVIIAGNQRYDAAIFLGLKKAPTFLMEGITEEKEREITIRDNVRNGKWNYELLETNWGDVPLIEWGVDMPEMIKQKEGPGAGDGENPVDYRALSPLELEEVVKERIDIADHVLFMFSGGKDSALTLVSMLPHMTGKQYEALYVDTGTEFPDLLRYVHEFCAGYQVPLRILKPQKNFWELYGVKKKFPDPIFRDCIGKMIHEPANIYSKSLSGNVLRIAGARKKQKTANSKNDFYKEYKKNSEWTINLLNPIMYMSNAEYDDRIWSLNLWPGYAAGFKRTSCWCCPFHGAQQYDALKKNYPLCWDVLREMAISWEFPRAKGSVMFRNWQKYWKQFE